MASRHPRVQVPIDREALRALALRGAGGLEADREAQSAGREFLVSVAEGTSALDLDALRIVRDRAWR